MRRHLLCSVAALALAAAWGGAAQAGGNLSGDHFDWTGVYVGAHAGLGGGHYLGGRELLQNDLDDPPELAKDLNLIGILGGVHLGYNHQFNRSGDMKRDLVLGLEADVSFPHWDDTIEQDDGSDVEGISGSIDVLASVRGRLGVAHDRTLVYATAGIAIPHATFSAFQIGGTGGVDDVVFNGIGGVFGGGVEFAKNDRIRFRAEGLYYCFNLRRGADGFETGDFATFHNAFVARVGVSVKIGDGS